MAKSVEEGIEIAESLGEEELFISGGGAIYEYCLTNGLVDKAYITTIHSSFEGDTFFKGFNRENWYSITQSHFEPDEKNAHAMTFEQYVKI